MPEYDEDEKYREILNNAACGICVLSCEDPSSPRIEFFNDAFCAVTNSTSDQLIASYEQDALGGIDEEWRDRVSHTFIEACTSEEDRSITYRALLPDRTGRWTNVHFRPNRTEDGRLLIYATFFDVSNERLHELSIAESEQTLKLVTENAGIWYWVNDWPRDTAYMSPLLVKEFEVPSVVEHFDAFFDGLGFLHQGFRDQFREALDAVKAGESSRSVDIQSYLKDGSIHWMRIELNALFDDDGTTTKALGTARLIDDIKEIEKKYRIEKDRSSSDGENLLGHTIYNLSENYIVSFSGLDHGDTPVIECTDIESLGHRITPFILSTDARVLCMKYHSRDFFLSLYEKGVTEQSIEYRRLMPDGSARWVQEVFHLLNDPDSSSILLFTYCYDITRQKSLDIMMSFAVNDDYDLLGIANFQDGMATMMLGRSSYNIYNTNLVEEDYQVSLKRFRDNAIVAEEQDEYFAKASLDNIRTVLSKQTSFEFNFHMIDSDGATRAKRVNYTTYIADPNVCLFTQTDVTVLIAEEQRKQDELKAAVHDAEVANRSKSNFLSNMSHEIRTPLNAIIGMTNLADDVEGNPEETTRYLKEIDSSSQYLLGILNDVLDMSRIESGNLVLHRQWVSPYECIKSCITMIEPATTKRGITLLVDDVEKSRDCQLFTDQLRLRQIYMNLLNNAAKFTGTGGTIEVTFQNKKQGAHTIVTRTVIRDNGCGMSEEFLTRIFQPFEQERNRYSTVTQGTGLGLSLTKHIVEAMGGTIEVESQLDRGSAFTFTIPFDYRIVETNGKEKRKAKTSADLQGKRILLVDDHPLNRQIAEALLLKKGADITIACDGVQAVDTFKGSDVGFFDAILMDIRMPRMDGLEATRTIRALPREDAGTVAIIAMTANAFSEDMQTSFEAGMNEHLAKPFEPEDLYRILGACISS